VENAVTLKYVRLGEFDIGNDTDCIQELNGQLDCTDPPVDYTIEKIIPHPLYNPRNPSKHHDLAILKLNDVVKYSDFVQPICLPTKEFDKGLVPGKPHMVTGWGKTDLCESRGGLARQLSIKKLFLQSNRSTTGSWCRVQSS
jgi:Trypsin